MEGDRGRHFLGRQCVKMVEGDRGRHFLGRQCVCFLTESSEEEDVIGTSVGVAGRGEREKMSNEVLALLW